MEVKLSRELIKVLKEIRVSFIVLNMIMAGIAAILIVKQEGNDMIKINCQYSDRISLCKNIKVKRGFFGFGPRVCIEYGTSKVCEFKRQYKKPLPTPPPPPPLHKEQRLKDFQTRECKRELMECKRELIKAYTNMMDGVSDKELDEESIQSGLIFLIGKSKQERIQCFTERLNRESLKGLLARLDRIKKRLPQLF